MNNIIVWYCASGNVNNSFMDQPAVLYSECSHCRHWSIKLSVSGFHLSKGGSLVQPLSYCFFTTSKVGPTQRNQIVILLIICTVFLTPLSMVLQKRFITVSFYKTLTQIFCLIFIVNIEIVQ